MTIRRRSTLTPVAVAVVVAFAPALNPAVHAYDAKVAPRLLFVLDDFGLDLSRVGGPVQQHYQEPAPGGNESFEHC